MLTLNLNLLYTVVNILVLFLLLRKFLYKPVTCNEGDLKWVDKTIVPTLPTWEGDAIFLKLLLENEENFFTLKLVYEGESLVDQKLEIY